MEVTWTDNGEPDIGNDWQPREAGEHVNTAVPQLETKHLCVSRLQYQKLAGRAESGCLL